MKTHEGTFAQKIRPEAEAQETLTVLGSGITGLMTVWQAAKKGYSITVLSQSPDPRVKSDNDNPQFSSTFDGMDQRYITLFEGHPYLYLAGYVDKMYPEFDKAFTTHVLEGGLLALPLDKFTEDAQQWLKQRMEKNAELRAQTPAAVEKVTALFTQYERENRASMREWHNFLREILQIDPQLIKNLSLSYEGILRLYDNAEIFNTAVESHTRGGVLKRTLAPEQLAEEYPVYAQGVQNGFIRGGAIEITGLTLGVKSLGEAMITSLEKKGVKFRFDTPVEKLVVKVGVVQGLELTGQSELHTSKHYMLHPGAFAQQKLFEDVPQVQEQLAAVEGYWITIENADKILDKMGYKPNKVHGQQALMTLIEKLPEEHRQKYMDRFAALGLDAEKLGTLAPIVDFNNMPIQHGDKKILGVGSGYIFKGFAHADKNGKSTFQNDEKSETFMLTIMELWLDVLHGRDVLNTGSMTAHKQGCKRSWTLGDAEIDLNLGTNDGGVCGIRGGGNTGDTSKSLMVARYNTELMKLMKNSATQIGIMASAAVGLRRSMGLEPKDTTWKDEYLAVHGAVKHAQRASAIIERIELARTKETTQRKLG